MSCSTAEGPPGGDQAAGQGDRCGGAHGGHGLSLKLAARTARPTGLVEPVRSGRPERPDARPAGAGARDSSVAGSVDRGRLVKALTERLAALPAVKGRNFYSPSE